MREIASGECTGVRVSLMKGRVGENKGPRDKEGLIEGIGRGIETIKNIKDEE